MSFPNDLKLSRGRIDNIRKSDNHYCIFVDEEGNLQYLKAGSSTPIRLNPSIPSGLLIGCQGCCEGINPGSVMDGSHLVVNSKSKYGFSFVDSSSYFWAAKLSRFSTQVSSKITGWEPYVGTNENYKDGCWYVPDDEYGMYTIVASFTFDPSQQKGRVIIMLKSNVELTRWYIPDFEGTFTMSYTRIEFLSPGDSTGFKLELNGNGVQNINPLGTFFQVKRDEKLFMSG
jgi:hypothetical protein